MKTIKTAMMCMVALMWAAVAHGATLLPPGENCFYDPNGNPLSGGTVGFFIPTTSTPKSTFLDPNSVTANSNPVVLNASGCAIIYGSGSYRQILKSNVGTLIWDQLTASTDATNGVLYGGISTGTGNAQVIVNSAFAGVAGQVVSFKAGFTNTGPLTINAGTGVIPVLQDLRSGPTALTGGEVRLNNMVMAIYDGANFHLVSIPPTTTDYQAFAVAGAATWTKPNVTASAMTTIQCWGSGGGGGANATGGSGGGGGFNTRTILTSLLGATETVTIPAGGAINTAGTNATFGTWVTACGGGAGENGANGGGGGGGGQTAGLIAATCIGANGAAGAGGVSGGPLSVAADTSGFSGGGGSDGTGVGAFGGYGYYGGGGGGGGAGKPGGLSVWGGGGGATGAGVPGTSSYGGAGGATTVAGSAPGGGGGRNAAGGRGECRVWTNP